MIRLSGESIHNLLGDEFKAIREDWYQGLGMEFGTSRGWLIVEVARTGRRKRMTGTDAHLTGFDGY